MKAIDVINARIMEQLDAGVVPWVRPWNVNGVPHQNLVSKKPYHGINAMLTSSCGYGSPYWVTFKAITEHDARLKKGEHGLPITFWNFVEAKDAKQKDKKIPFIRFYKVWNVEQLEDVGTFKIPEMKTGENVIEDRPSARQIFEEYILMEQSIEVRHGGDRACYSPVMDYIALPNESQFKSAEGYWGTAFHEAVHSTGHKARLDRDTLNAIKNWGDHEYSREELVAEIGACYLLNESDIEPDIKNSASYISGWSRKLKEDSMLFVTAASRAEKAALYILGERETEEEVAEEAAICE